mgnify:CR=1 FL=1
MDFLQISQQVPIPNDGDTDTQYSIKLLAFMGTLLLVGLGFATREYFRYRNAQDAKRDANDERREAERKQEWRDAEAARVAARERLHGEIQTEFADIRADTKQLFGTLADENKALREQIQALGERILRLEVTKPQK